MFNTLIESRATRQKSWGSTTFSFVVHCALISTAAYLTYHADQAFAKPKVEKVEFVAVKKVPPPPKTETKPPPPNVVVTPPPPKGFLILTAPIKIPDVIPEIDLSHAVTRADDFSATGTPGGTAAGVPGGVPQGVTSDEPYSAFQVEKQAQAGSRNPPPVYPALLRSGGIEGDVLLSFVVDTTGRADMKTVTVVTSTHALFATAARTALEHYTFIPAEIGGKKVKQLVRLPFIFSLNK